MASMEEALCSYILTKSVVTDIIGTGSSARLYSVVLPQDCDLADGAAATYEIIYSSETSTLADRSGFVQSRVQISCFANRHLSATTLARAIKNCGIATLKGASGGIDFRGVMIEDGMRCFTEAPTDGNDTWRYIAEFDLRISYLEG